MSFQNSQLLYYPYCFLTFCSSDQSLLPFIFKIFVLNSIYAVVLGGIDNFERIPSMYKIPRYADIQCLTVSLTKFLKIHNIQCMSVYCKGWCEGVLSSYLYYFLLKSGQQTTSSSFFTFPFSSLINFKCKMFPYW